MNPRDHGLTLAENYHNHQTFFTVCFLAVGKKKTMTCFLLLCLPHHVGLYSYMGTD